MGAECHDCGTDLVYAEWPRMECPVCSVQGQRDELAEALRWIVNNCKPYGPAQAHAANALRRCGLPLEFREERQDG